MYRTIGFWTILAASSLIAISIAAAASPQLINYQGRATDNSGLPLTGTYSLTFRIYDSAASGNLIWSETQNAVNVSGGLFTVLLGSVTPLGEGVFTSPDRFLTVQIGADPELSPRQRIVAVAYALTAVEADSTSWSGIKGIPAGFADGTDNVGTGDITAVNTSGGLTGGVTSGDANLSIAGGGVTSSHIGDGQITNVDINNSASIAATKISGVALTLSGTQTVTGAKTFNGQTSFGDSTMRVDNNGVSIGSSSFGASDRLLSVSRKFNIAAQRTGISTEISNSADNGILFGLISNTTAVSPSASNCYGIATYATTDGLRIGLSAFARANTITPRSGIGYGVRSDVQYGAEDYGVFGLAYSSDEGYGVYGQARLALGFGVGVYGFGYQNFSSAYGVYGITTTNNSHGYGVYGRAQGNDGNGYGVYGSAVANAASWAGYFSGDVNVTGTIFTPAKLTRIDHPTDPESKYLLLSSVDSPEMLNTHCGNAILDAAGEATVLLPESFAKVCRDYRYQLTCVGGYAPVYIAQEVTGNEFRIAGGTVGLKVSWQIIALRNDNFARTFPLTNEKAKRPDELGKYLHPAAFGLDEASGIDYEHNRPVGKQSESQLSSGRP